MLSIFTKSDYSICGIQIGVVYRYLTLIYCFGKGTEEKIYISSADMMTRNLNRRVEIACPIYDAEIKEQLKWILSCQLRDDTKASFVMADGIYSRKQGRSHVGFNCQDEFMRTSPHKQITFVPEKQSIIQKLKKSFAKVLEKI